MSAPHEKARHKAGLQVPSPLLIPASREGDTHLRVAGIAFIAANPCQSISGMEPGS
jgi:hypothetical protein